MTAPPGAVRGRSDALLVGAAIRGDLVAWEQLVRRHQEPAYRMAYLIARDSQVAEAATQSAFTRAYRALPQLDAGQPLLPWLFRIVAGETRQALRDVSRPRPSSRPIEILSGPHLPASPVPGLSQAEGLTPAQKTALRDAFDRLAEEDRLTLASRYLFEQSRSDAAAMLAISSSLVDERLVTALRHLRARIAGA